MSINHIVFNSARSVMFSSARSSIIIRPFMAFKNRMALACLVALAALLPAFGAGQIGSHAASLSRSKAGAFGAAIKNSWRGITPLQSSAADVARIIGLDSDPVEATASGPFKVDGGEVTFSFLTPSIAKIYRAPRTMVGKVFTIYFKPDDQMTRADLKLAPSFKQCVEQQTKLYYYLVNEAGVAYRFRRTDDAVETVIYQPSQSEVRRLAVITECVF